jgi:hypothetical protein
MNSSEHPILEQFGPQFEPINPVRKALNRAIQELVDGYERRLAKAHHIKTPTGEVILAGRKARVIPGLSEPARPEVTQGNAQGSIVDVEFTGAQGNYSGGAVHLTADDIKGFAAGFPDSQARVIASIKESKSRFIAW